MILLQARWANTGCGKMLKRVQILEDGRVPAKETINWRIEGQKRRITRNEYQKRNRRFSGADRVVGLDKRENHKGKRGVAK